MKRRILFVDDELRILQGLNRMLRVMRNEWDMDFVLSGEDALKKLDESKFDVIVTDMRMPVMDGAALLSEVMKRHPQVVRIVLSGHSDKELILKTVKSAHQYLSKPCETENLKKTVIRACALRDLLSSDELVQMISEIDTLPSLPSLYTKIMDELNTQEPSMSKIGEIIESDISMSAKILQLVNSSFFGLPRHISSPSQAVTLLGLETVKSLVLTVQVFSQFNQNDFDTVNIEEVWQHSMRVARFAKLICKEEGLDLKLVDNAMLGGLLHDLGKLIFASNRPKEYMHVYQVAKESGQPLHKVEKQILKTTHAEVGAYLIGLWGLPDTVIEALAYHHYPDKIQVDGLSPFISVYLANLFDHELAAKKVQAKPREIDKEFINNKGFGEKIDLWRNLCEQDLMKE